MKELNYHFNIVAEVLTNNLSQIIELFILEKFHRNGAIAYSIYDYTIEQLV